MNRLIIVENIYEYTPKTKEVEVIGVADTVAEALALVTEFAKKNGLTGLGDCECYATLTKGTIVNKVFY